jgi:crotonobetainyl-CoA:carnitine CoA-transferase CaiB-like acyl-CoA transferase
MLLGAMGAEVIKIETMKRPDEQRVQHGGGISKEVETSSNFLEVNLNKLSATINLTTQKGQELARKLVSISDIVVENMRPGVMDKLGLGYDKLVQVKPDIIMASLSGFGGKGPYRSFTAYNPCFSSFGGAAHLSGYADGEPNTMTSAGDARAGTAGAFAILMALNIRQRTGKGQFIDLSSVEVHNFTIGDQMMDYAMNARSPKREGNRDVIMAPHNCYRCKGHDSWISIASQAEWDGLVSAMGAPDWTHDTKFATATRRWSNQQHLDELMTNWTRNQDAHELTDLLQKHGVPAAPSYKASELFSHEHLIQREAITEIDHPVIGHRKTIAPPWGFSQTPAKVHKTAPLMGENNRYVFCELLGLSEADVRTLAGEMVIY